MQCVIGTVDLASMHASSRWDPRLAWDGILARHGLLDTELRGDKVVSVTNESTGTRYVNSLFDSIRHFAGILNQNSHL